MHCTNTSSFSLRPAGDLNPSDERSETLSDRVSVLLAPLWPWTFAEATGSEFGGWGLFEVSWDFFCSRLVSYTIMQYNTL